MNDDKLIELEELAEIISRLKKQNKKVVLSHGVFDLLHVGHVRHFKAAKKLGDILVTTITPDKYVNKGPHRPAFKEELRAESIAALDTVDYVAINRWPTSAKTIKLLKPDIYAKGMDYFNPSNDITRGIIAEKNAVMEVGGEIKFTDEITFSSSSLVNKYLDVLPKKAKNFLAEFSKTYSPEEIIGHLEKINNLKILVIGEAIIDEYQYGQSIGKAAKESIIALKYLETEKYAGGALAVANHLANFSDNVDLFTLLGEFDSQEDFISKKLNKKINKIFHYKKNSPTIVKRRCLEKNPLTKLLEFYVINDDELDKEQTLELKKHLEKILLNYDIVLVADFGHGMFNKDLINLIAKKAKFLVVNTQTNAGNFGYNVISKYPRADYVCTDERELRLETLDKHSTLFDLISTVSKKIYCDKMIVTQGREGCITYSSGQTSEIPAFSESVLDTMGAGDAFLSITAPLVALNIKMDAVGFVGNAVGAMYVKVIGNKEPIDKVSLSKYITSIMK